MVRNAEPACNNCDDRRGVKPRLFYLSLERLRPASAADTHVRGILGALEELGWTTTLFAEVSSDQNRPNFLRQMFRYVWLQFSLGIRLRRCDLVFVRQHFSSIPIVVVARALGWPVVVELNGLPEDSLISYPILRRFRRAIEWSYRIQFGWASHVFAVTQGLCVFVRQQAKLSRVTVTPNGADIVLFRNSLQPRPDDCPHGLYVVTFGDFALWHDIALVMAAVRNPAWPKNVKMLFIGQGTAALNPYVDADLAGRVTWLERRSQPELVPYIVNAMAGLVPISNHAGRGEIGVMPLKLLEILSCGRPAVVTDLPGQAQLINDNGCGIVVSGQDPKCFAVAVAALADDLSSTSDMGRRGRALVEAHFSWRAVASPIDRLLRGLIGSA